MLISVMDKPTPLDAPTHPFLAFGAVRSEYYEGLSFLVLTPSLALVDHFYGGWMSLGAVC